MRDSDLVKQVATILAAGTGWAWRPTGPAYTATETGVYYGQVSTAPDAPHRACGITPYGPTDDLSDVPGLRRVQLWLRGDKGDPDSADDLADAAFDILHGLMRVGGIHLMKRVSSAQLGIDGNGRRLRADNYEIQPELET
ncbi:phage tail terminator protein [Promicromonospora sp. NFX87]|uniref:phage tail terminator protein n=1 Tax=Promicromonospora sp. NFX87 TaxID=3402691 RepID=UPI003AFAFF16